MPAVQRSPLRTVRSAPMPLTAYTSPTLATTSRYLTSHTRYAMAHRGGAGLAPENTMAAFRRSYDLGIRYLETDVRMTADGVCLAFHDATVNRVTCGTGKVSERDWSLLRLLDVEGEPIARIEDVIEEFPDAHLAIDLKEARALRPLISLLRRTGAVDRICFSGARDRLLGAARDLAGPELATALGWESTTRLVMAARTGTRPPKLPPAEFVHVPQRLARIAILNQRLLSMAHDLGLKVIVWTVDDPFQMKSLLEAGVDGVISDRPDLLRAVLTGRGLWPGSDPQPMMEPDRLTGGLALQHEGPQDVAGLTA